MRINLTASRAFTYNYPLRILWGLMLVSACGFKPAASGASDGGVDDAMPDVFIEIDAVVGDAPALCTTWHPADFEPCAIGSPMGDVHLTTAGSPYVYDTSQMGGELRDKNGTVLLMSPLTLMQADNTFVALLSIDKLTIDPAVTWNVIGSKPRRPHAPSTHTTTQRTRPPRPWCEAARSTFPMLAAAGTRREA